MKAMTWVVLLITLLSLNLAKLSARTYEPNPLKIDLNIDDEKSAEKVFSPEGGELSLKAYGKTYTLTVPPGALIGTPTLKMKAIRSARGIPTSAGFITGVEISPQSIQFLKPVTLKITSGLESFKDATQAIGFGVEEKGEEFHLRGLNQGSESSYEMDLQDLGGYGVTQANAEEVQQIQKQHPPTDASDWFEQNTIDIDELEIKQEMIALYNEALITIRAATSNPFAMDMAFSQFKTWSIRYSSLSTDLQNQLAAEKQELITNLAVAFQTSVQVAQSKCLGSDLYQIKQLIRWSTLLLIHPEVMAYVSMSPEEIRQAAESCARFEIEIESRIHDRDDDGFMGDTEVFGVIKVEPLYVSHGGLKLAGEGTLDYTKTEFNMGSDSCPTEVKTFTGTSRISQLSLGLDLESTGKNSSAPGSFIRSLVRFSFLPSPEMNERVESDCPYMPPVDMHFWYNGWNANNVDQMNRDPTSGLGPGAYIEGLIPGTGSVIGKRTYQRENVGTKEDTTYKVIHTPGQ